MQKFLWNFVQNIEYLKTKTTETARQNLLYGPRLESFLFTSTTIESASRNDQEGQNRATAQQKQQLDKIFLGHFQKWEEFWLNCWLHLGRHKQLLMGVSEEAQRLVTPENREPNPDATGQNEHVQHRWLRSLKGIMAGVLHMVSHIVGITNLQLLRRRIPDLELQTFRCSGVFFFCVVWMFVEQRLPIVPIPDLPAMLLYSFLVAIQITATYIGFALIPATAAQCSLNTFILLSGLFIFWICGQEWISLRKVFCAVLCVVGAVFVIQPWHNPSQNHAAPSLVWHDESMDCTFLLQKVCSPNFEINSQDNLTSCKNLTYDGINERKILCQSLQNDVATGNVTQELQFNCKELIWCWFKTELTAKLPVLLGGEKKNQSKTELFQLQLPQKYGTLLGYIFTGWSGICYPLVAAVSKRYPSIGKDIMRSLFWSFFLGLTSSFVLTFIIESPVLPHSSFDMVAVFLHTLAAVGDWVFWVYSLKYISGTVVNIITSTAVVFLLIPQYTILSSILPGQRNWMEVAGVFIVLSGFVLASLLETFQKGDNNWHQRKWLEMWVTREAVTCLHWWLFCVVALKDVHGSLFWQSVSVNCPERMWPIIWCHAKQTQFYVLLSERIMHISEETPSFDHKFSSVSSCIHTSALLDVFSFDKK